MIQARVKDSFYLKKDFVGNSDWGIRFFLFEKKGLVSIQLVFEIHSPLKKVSIMMPKNVFYFPEITIL